MTLRSRWQTILLKPVQHLDEIHIRHHQLAPARYLDDGRRHCPEQIRLLNHCQYSRRTTAVVLRCQLVTSVKFGFLCVHYLQLLLNETTQTLYLIQFIDKLSNIYMKQNYIQATYWAVQFYMCGCQHHHRNKQDILSLQKNVLALIGTFKTMTKEKVHCFI